MNVLVLRPTLQALNYAAFSNGESQPALTGRLDGCRGSLDDCAAIRSTVLRVWDACLGALPGGRPDVAALHAPFGGSPFAGPALAGPDTIEKIASLVSQAPLQLAALPLWIRSCEQVFSLQPLVLVFETAFFAKLPLMVTGGLTPLEGLPGETTCGEIDPSIVLALAQEWKWGPEQINRALTQESGLKGLADRPAPLAFVGNPPRFAGPPCRGRGADGHSGRVSAAGGSTARRLGARWGVPRPQETYRTYRTHRIYRTHGVEGKRFAMLVLILAWPPRAPAPGTLYAT